MWDKMCYLEYIDSIISLLCFTNAIHDLICIFYIIPDTVSFLLHEPESEGCKRSETLAARDNIPEIPFPFDSFDGYILPLRALTLIFDLYKQGLYS